MPFYSGSIVTLQFGQCGNQLGSQLFDNLAKFEFPQANSRDIFFETSPESMRARSVLVDMEPKVISSCLKKRRVGWEYDPSAVFTGDGGSGNNWAAGHNIHGPKACEHVIELIRRQVEAVDVLSGFLALHSLAGGTGSGIGSYFTQQVKDEFRPPALVNSVVWPHASGEVAVQNYNSLFTLAHLMENADAIISQQNDIASHICTKYLHIQRPSLSHLNGVLSQDLSGVLLPSSAVESSRQYFVERNILLSITTQLCPHPDYKMLEATTFPQLSASSLDFGSFNWKSVLRDLQRAVAPKHGGLGIRSTPSGASASNMLFLRGLDPTPAISLLQTEARELAQGKPPGEPVLDSIWNSTQSGGIYIKSGRTKQPESLCGYDKRATLLSNSNRIAPLLDRVVHKSCSMYRCGAYVHQYVKYGVEKDEFVEAMRDVEEVLQRYRCLKRRG